MRGQRTLFDELLTTETKARIAGDKQRPRNVLMPERNALLIHRYYYYFEICRMRFDDILKQLETEFFIVGGRIVVILTENDAQFRKVMNQKPDRAALEKIYPHINWRYSPR